jgi:hypothetical protein
MAANGATARTCAAAVLTGAIVAALAACPGSRHRVECVTCRNEITALWTQIRDWRREAGMEVEPSASAVVAMRPMSVSSAARVCVARGQIHDRCTDVCDLADAICDNAESICGIAGELGDDAWARDKCDSAKASCREAQERCCRCDRDADEQAAWTQVPEASAP